MKIHTNRYKNPIEIETDETDLILRCKRCGGLFMSTNIGMFCTHLDVAQDDEGNYLCKHCEEARSNPDCED